MEFINYQKIKNDLLNRINDLDTLRLTSKEKNLITPEESKTVIENITLCQDALETPTPLILETVSELIRLSENKLTQPKINIAANSHNILPSIEENLRELLVNINNSQNLTQQNSTQLYFLRNLTTQLNELNEIQNVLKENPNDDKALKGLEALLRHVKNLNNSMIGAGLIKNGANFTMKQWAAAERKYVDGLPLAQESSNPQTGVFHRVAKSAAQARVESSNNPNSPSSPRR